MILTSVRCHTDVRDNNVTHNIFTTTDMLHRDAPLVGSLPNGSFSSSSSPLFRRAGHDGVRPAGRFDDAEDGGTYPSRSGGLSPLLEANDLNIRQEFAELERQESLTESLRARGMAADALYSMEQAIELRVRIFELDDDDDMGRFRTPNPPFFFFFFFPFVRFIYIRHRKELVEHN